MNQKNKMSRRDFMSTTAGTAGTFLALSSLGAKAEFAEKMLSSEREKTVIKVVYMAKPVPTWPCPDIDLNAEMKKINSILTDLKNKTDRNIEFVGRELVRTADDIPRFQKNLGDIDGIFAFNLTSTCSPMFIPIVDIGYPTVLFSQPYSGHDWSLVADMQKQGKKVDVVASSDFNDLEPFIRIIDTVRKTKQTVVLCLRSNLKKSDDITAIEKKYGLAIELLDYSELNKMYKQADKARATEMADKFIAGAMRMVEPKRTDVIESMRLFLAIKELIKRHGSEVITIDCLGGFNRKDLPAYPCVAWTLLNNNGQIGVCEADLNATMTQILLQYLTGKPGFVSDPVIDTKTNTVIHAHCVSATKMDGPQGPSAPYAIRTHMEDNKGVSLQVKMRTGQDITLAKLTGGKTMLLSTGKIIDNPDLKRGCRTKVTTEVTDADKMLHGYTGGLHRLLFYGDYVEDIEKMGRLMGFEVVMEI